MAKRLEYALVKGIDEFAAADAEAARVDPKCALGWRGPHGPLLASLMSGDGLTVMYRMCTVNCTLSNTTA